MGSRSDGEWAGEGMDLAGRRIRHSDATSGFAEGIIKSMDSVIPSFYNKHVDLKLDILMPYPKGFWMARKRRL